MTEAQVAQEIINQNTFEPSRCFDAVKAIAMVSGLEVDAMNMKVMTLMIEEVMTAYHRASQ